MLEFISHVLHSRFLGIPVLAPLAAIVFLPPRTLATHHSTKPA
jgi:hypothetical protein